MSPGLQSRGTLAGWILTFVLLAGVYAAATASIPRLFGVLSRQLPDNYRYVAHDLMTKGEFARAEQIVRKRLGQQFYDFEARYLLADIQANAGQPKLALATLDEAMQKYAGVRNRAVKALGFSERTTYFLFGTYSAAAGNYITAGEMLRASVDAGMSAQDALQPLLTSTNEQAEFGAAELALKQKNAGVFEHVVVKLRAQPGTRAKALAAVLESRSVETLRSNGTGSTEPLLSAAEELSTPPLVAATWANLLAREPELATSTSESFTSAASIKEADLSQFQIPIGGVLTSNSLVLSRNGAASARIDTGVFKVTTLLLRVRATEALGMAPILIVRSGETELARLYLDGLQPKAYDLPLWPGGAPKQLPITLSFENDAYDPVTGADRNIEVLQLAFH